MRAHAVRSLVAADTHQVLRDPLLGWMLLLPLGLALLLRVLIPRIGAALLAAARFDVAAYHPLIMSGYLMSAAGMAGIVIGFVLLDERDERTLTALRVTPFTLRRYLAYRITLPLLLGTGATLAGYPLVGISPLPVADLLPIAVVAGLSAPSLALLLAAAAPNKVAGFAVVKVLNGVNLVPVAAYFVPLPLQLAAGVLPAYWPMRALWSATAGEEYTGYLAAGVIVGVLAIALTAWLFERRLLRQG